MRKISLILAGAIGIVLVVNGLWMLVDAGGWFAANRIVWRTGVANAHFIRDVGWTYAAVGGLATYGAVAPARRDGALGIAVTWLLGHAAIHLGEVATGICSVSDFGAEWPSVWGPPILLGIAWLIERGTRPTGR